MSGMTIVDTLNITSKQQLLLLPTNVRRAHSYSEMHRMISTVRIFIHENKVKTSKTQRNTFNFSIQEKSTKRYACNSRINTVAVHSTETA